MAGSGSDDRPHERLHESSSAQAPAATATAHRRLARRTAAPTALAGVLLAAALAIATPALALSQRGHAFSFSFGEGGVGPGRFSHPAGVAVDDATGQVYVADARNNRVQEFKPRLAANGELVGEQYESELRVPFPQAVAVDDSTSEGDPSKGDVYVVGTTGEEAKEPEPEELIVYKFSAEGTLLAKLRKFKAAAKDSETEDFESIQGIAVDAAGNLFVYQEDGMVDELNDAERNEGLTSVQSLAAEGKPGFAVDSEGDFYAGAEELVGGDPEEEELTQQIAEEDEHDGVVAPARFDVVTRISGVSGEVEVPELDPEDTLAVAVNPRTEAGNEVAEMNDVYLANVTSVAGEDRTTVAAFSPPAPGHPHGTLIQRFGAPGLEEGDGIAVDSTTGAVYVADARSDRVDVFGLEARAAPTVAGLQSCTPESGSAGGCSQTPGVTTLKAQVDPTGLDTEAYFEYGPSRCGAGASSCTTTPEVDLGAGFAEVGAHASLAGLPTGTYYYRVVARNASGTVRGAEGSFAIVAAASGLPDGRAWEMVSPVEKTGGTPEAISPSGGAIQAAADGNAITYIAEGSLPSNGEPEGNRNPEYTQVLSTRGPDGWSSQDIDTATTGGSGVHVGTSPEYHAFSPDLALALVQPFEGAAHSGGFAEPPLSPLLPGEEAGKQEKTIYLRDDTPESTLQPAASEAASYDAAKADGEDMHNAGFLALVNHANAPGGEPFGGGNDGQSEGIEFEGATPELSHVAFQSERAAPGVYEWGPAGALRLVSELPAGTRVTTAALGGPFDSDARNAISADGSRVIWTDDTAGGHLYLRDTVTQETLQLDAVQPGASGEGEVDPAFQTASVTGSRVFFTDTQRLTANSKAGHFTEKLPDLYVAEVNGGDAPGNPISYTLTDLTPEGVNGESSDVLVNEGSGGGVLGASEDGSRVYFVANGALSPEAEVGHCSVGEAPRPPGTTCNLYERVYNGREWTPTKLIAALSFEDAPDWGGTSAPGDLAHMSSRVSANGEYLAFMSDRSLTGYDNEDVTSKAPGERLDEEVFLYEAPRERLVCASCNPNGTQPEGIFDTRANGHDGLGLLVDRQEDWAYKAGEKLVADHWLAASIPGWTPLDIARARYQSRYLSESGRLFFNSPSKLVPASTSPKEKVYEYEPGGVGSCQEEGGCVALLSSGTAEHESAFLDASVSGNDVFFLTAEKLVQQDPDDNFDVYDAHVCEPSSPCPAAPASGSPPCMSLAQCRPGTAATAGVYGAPASTGSATSGNVSQVQVLSSRTAGKPAPKPPTRAQRLARALRACRRIERTSRRHACEAQARHKYGPVKKAGVHRRPAGRRAR
jgi:DNA-binding beta-propeller fold protein YncE